MSGRPVMPTHETMTWLVKQGRKIERLGSVSGTAGVPLYRAQGRARFTGKVWLPTSSGTRVLYLANTDSTKLNVHVDKSGLSVAGFVEETNTPIPSSWGPDEFWYPKSEIAGSLIIP